METTELNDDRGSWLDGRFLGEGCACPSEGTVLDEGSYTVGDVTSADGSRTTDPVGDERRVGQTAPKARRRPSNQC